MSGEKINGLRFTSTCGDITVILEEHSEQGLVGSRNVTTSVTLSYQELVNLLNKRVYKKKASSRHYKSEGARISRTINLLVSAVQTGQWCNRANIDKTQMLHKLILLLEGLELSSLTPIAKAKLINLRINLPTLTDTEALNQRFFSVTEPLA